jgi:hypothetical protein
MKYRFIHDSCSTFRVKKMCRVFTISRSGYYGWKKQTGSPRKKENEKLVGHVIEIYTRNRQIYGSPRITKELNAQGISCGENRIPDL